MAERIFRFKRFSVDDSHSALKLGTDAVVLGATMTMAPGASRMLDIGTGCGVIALMAAQRTDRQGEEGPRITGIDCDAGSAAEAARNFAASPWADRLDAVCRPLQNFEAGEFDHIFSNPPFYDNSLHNPSERLAAARHTVSLTPADICAFAASRLTEGGRLSLIVPSESEKGLLRTAASFGLYPSRIVRVKTVEGKAPRRIVAEFAKSRTSEVAEEELVLQEAGGRSARYRQLTGDFYL